MWPPKVCREKLDDDLGGPDGKRKWWFGDFEVNRSNESRAFFWTISCGLRNDALFSGSKIAFDKRFVFVSRPRLERCIDVWHIHSQNHRGTLKFYSLEPQKFIDSTLQKFPGTWDQYFILMTSCPFKNPMFLQRQDPWPLVVPRPPEPPDQAWIYGSKDSNWTHREKATWPIG